MRSRPATARARTEPSAARARAAGTRPAPPVRPVRLDRRDRLVLGFSLLSTGLLAGAFGYGAANLVPTFDAVPIGTRLEFHSALMKRNSVTMQAAMAASVLGALALAALTRGRDRVLAAAAGLSALASFLITRFGNVPINGRIKRWAATAPPPDHAEVLRRWELFHHARTLTAVAAFALLVLLALRPGATRPPARTDPGGGAAE
ncbi:anthrone oxygenase family protein [Streptomyces sp. NPDC018031]|uniref:anthrone oxygenase family protein n=1 Tax=Streptomyces sp. NPDC018031 TaxID=3365033 RepID=UPI0037A8DF95